MCWKQFRGTLRIYRTFDIWKVCTCLKARAILKELWKFTRTLTGTGSYSYKYPPILLQKTPLIRCSTTQQMDKQTSRQTNTQPEYKHTNTQTNKHWNKHSFTKANKQMNNWLIDWSIKVTVTRDQTQITKSSIFLFYSPRVSLCKELNRNYGWWRI